MGIIHFSSHPKYTMTVKNTFILIEIFPQLGFVIFTVPAKLKAECKYSFIVNWAS